MFARCRAHEIRAGARCNDIAVVARQQNIVNPRTLTSRIKCTCINMANVNATLLEASASAGADPNTEVGVENIRKTHPHTIMGSVGNVYQNDVSGDRRLRAS